MSIGQIRLLILEVLNNRKNYLPHKYCDKLITAEKALSELEQQSSEPVELPEPRSAALLTQIANQQESLDRLEAENKELKEKEIIVPEGFAYVLLELQPDKCKCVSWNIGCIYCHPERIDLIGTIEGLNKANDWQAERIKELEGLLRVCHVWVTTEGLKNRIEQALKQNERN